MHRKMTARSPLSLPSRRMITSTQLRDLLSYHSIEVASGQDAERILESFMRKQENKRWDGERGDWVEVKS